MCAGRRLNGVWPISIPSSHSQGHSHICVTMVMLIRWLMTIHQWRCLIGQPPRAMWNVFISIACVPALPQYAPQNDEEASLLLSVCVFVSTWTPTSPLFSLITCLSWCPTHFSHSPAFLSLLCLNWLITDTSNMNYNVLSPTGYKSYIFHVNLIAALTSFLLPLLTKGNSNFNHFSPGHVLSNVQLCNFKTLCLNSQNVIL